MKLLALSSRAAAVYFVISIVSFTLCGAGSAFCASTSGSFKTPESQCYFRNFNGSVYRAGAEITKQTGLGWAREQFFWSRIDPKPGEWRWDDTDQTVLGAKRDGVVVLPDLAYDTAWDVSIPGNGFSPPQRVSDWEDFVEHVVARYSAPPFNLRYFQIWNEPTRQAGFWTGTDQEFIDKIYLPAAKIIRRHHCYVVFGGWPASNSLQEFDSLLEYHDAWRWTDFLDIHYEGLPYWVALYNRWIKTGKCRGVWETEISSTNPDYIPLTYLPMLHWSLEKGWNHADEFKLFWYAAWGAGSNARECLSTTDEKGKIVLTIQGQRLSVIAQALETGPLETFADFTTSGLPPDKVTLGFKNGSRKVIALMFAKTTAVHPKRISVKTSFPQKPGHISFVREDGTPVRLKEHYHKKMVSISASFQALAAGSGKQVIAYLEIDPAQPRR